LNWCGIVEDEGPSAGGAHGPYIQSQRTHLYRLYADELVQVC
jgi:glutamyl-tRNA synthetase